MNVPDPRACKDVRVVSSPVCTLNPQYGTIRGSKQDNSSSLSGTISPSDQELPVVCVIRDRSQPFGVQLKKWEEQQLSSTAPFRGTLGLTVLSSGNNG